MSQCTNVLSSSKPSSRSFAPCMASATLIPSLVFLDQCSFCRWLSSVEVMSTTSPLSTQWRWWLQVAGTGYCHVCNESGLGLTSHYWLQKWYARHSICPKPWTPHSTDFILVKWWRSWIQVDVLLVSSILQTSPGPWMLPDTGGCNRKQLHIPFCWRHHI